jgi:hypothetical protein
MACDPWIELSTDVLAAADMLLSAAVEGRDCCRHVGLNMVRPPTGKAINRAKRLLGFSLLPPGRQGERNWLLNAGWEARLERVGVHPQTLEIIDAQKWGIKLMRFDAEDREHLERKEHRLARTELKAVRESAKNGWTRSGSGRSLADQLKEPDEQEIDPSSIGGRLRSQRSDRISMRDY